MMNLKYLIITLISIVLLNSCKKEYIVDISPEYEGEWHSASIPGNDGDMEIYFIIEGNTGVLGEWCDLVPLGSNCSSVFSGDAKINRKKTKLYIGNSGFNDTGQIVLSIEVPPYLNSEGKWECTLTERVYIRN